MKLQFNNSVLDVGTVIEVSDAQGTLFSDGKPRLEGPIVTQKLTENLPDGAYRVQWRVVSSDGHPIDGSFAFAVGSNGKQALTELPASGGTDATPNHDHADHDHDHADHDHADHSHDHGKDASSKKPETQNDTQNVLWGSFIALAGAAVVIAGIVWFTRRSNR